MRTLIALTFSFFWFIGVGLSQKLKIETSFSRSFSGYGDYFGWVYEGSIGYDMYRNFILKVNLGKGSASQIFLSQDQLEEIPNLYVADQWLENFPGTYPDIFSFGFITRTPHMDFQLHNFYGLSLEKHIPIYKGLSISLELGVSRMNVKNSYTTAVKAIQEKYFEEETTVTIVIPNIINFDTYLTTYSVDISYLLKDDLRIGIKGTVMDGGITLSKLGINFSYIIF